MKKVIQNLLMLSVVCFLVGCATHAKKLDEMPMGSSQERVKEILGEPAKTGNYYGNEVWVYSLKTETYNMMTGFLGGGEEYWVLFEDSRMKDFGKKADRWPAATLQ